MAITISGSGGITFPDSTSMTSGTQACKAWVNFNGTGTVAIRAAFNVSSITDNGVGDYTVNFTTAMPDANYSAVLTPVKQTQDTTTNDTVILNIRSTTEQTASSIRIVAKQSSGGGYMTSFDPITVCGAFFR